VSGERSGEELEIMGLRKLRRTRRAILKNAALAAFAAPAIGQGGTTPQPGTSNKAATFVLVHGASMRLIEPGSTAR